LFLKEQSAHKIRFILFIKGILKQTKGYFVQKAVYKLVDERETEFSGGKTYRKYFVAKNRTEK